jgi:predicted nucleotidyltransferase component of viral defense system
MAKSPENNPASIMQRLLNLARQDQSDFGIVLIAYALERLVYRLSITDHRQNFILKGGMLVTLWTVDQSRFTRDVDFLSFGSEDEESLISIFNDILSTDAEDGLRFDTAALTATQIRDDQVYGGVRLKTTAYLDKTRIPITIDIGFGDSMTDPGYTIEYPSLLEFPSTNIRAYSPATVIAEKFHAVVALGLINGRMKDFYDLWAIPKAQPVSDDELREAVSSTFERRQTAIPTERPEGLSSVFTTDQQKSTQWLAYANSIDLEAVSLEQVADEVWGYLESVCNDVKSS